MDHTGLSKSNLLREALAKQLAGVLDDYKVRAASVQPPRSSSLSRVDAARPMQRMHNADSGDDNGAVAKTVQAVVDQEAKRSARAKRGR
jgi:hypothetical protein